MIPALTSTTLPRDAHGPGIRVRLPVYARELLPKRYPTERIDQALDAMRSEAVIMTPSMLRLAKASNFSFSRSLVDRLMRERWQVSRRHLQVGSDARGLIVYRIDSPGQTFTFAASCDGLPDVERTGRIMEDTVDFHGVLYEGEPDLERIRAESDEQMQQVWRGRTGNDVLGWSFANRSNRFFEATVRALADGTQPSRKLLSGSGGYLLRNAGFYGNGRHGTRAWKALGPDHPLGFPYHVDLFCLYLWRQFSFDFVEALARTRNPAAARLDPAIRRFLGIGNQSGIGMIAALVRWPHWLSAFCFCREFSLALAITDPDPSTQRLPDLRDRVARTARYYRDNDPDIDPAVEDRREIAAELERFAQHLDTVIAPADRAVARPGATLAAVLQWARETLTAGTVEQIVALIIDLHPEHVENLMPLLPLAMDRLRDVEPAMSVAGLRDLLEARYDWALAIDQSAPGARRYFWYRSEENGENRRGERAVDPGVAYETFVDVTHAVQGLYQTLRETPGEQSVAEFLVEHPDQTYIVSRVQFLGAMPYGEIQANIVHERFHPADLIRFYLHILGMETTNPATFRWVRGVFMQGAPLPEEIAAGSVQSWGLPSLEGAAQDAADGRDRQVGS